MRRTLVALAAALVLASPAHAQAPRLPHLLTSDSLAAWIARGRPVRLLDVRLDVWTYLKGHLPAAQYLSVETLRASRGGVPVQPLSAAQYGAMFRRLGLDPDVPVVVYSAGETLNIDATWVTWLLSAMGHPSVYLLDGGYFKWTLENREVARAYPRVPDAGRWWDRRAFRPDTASLDEVRRVVERGGALLVDARPTDQYVGDAGAQMRRGHIPGAISHWWQEDLETAGFGRVFKPIEALRAAYAAQGITPEKDVILYCNTSTEASHLWFALRALLGYPRVRIYAGSWTEWAEREDLPIATGPSRPAP